MRKIISLLGVMAVIIVAAVYLLQPTQLPVKKLDPWILQSNDPNDPYGTYIGNGYIGTRIGPEGVGSRDDKPLPCLMAGLYENEAMKPLPNWSDFPLYDGKGRRFVLDKSAPYRQTVNMREGYVETELTLKSGWQRLSGTVTTFILRPGSPASLNVAPNIVAVRYSLVPRLPGQIKSRNRSISSMEKWNSVKTTDSGVEVASTPSMGGAALATTTTTKVIVATLPSDPTSIPLHRHSPLVITTFTAASGAKGRGEKREIDRAIRAVKLAQEMGFNKLFAQHKRAWRDLWKPDIVIDGDPAAQQAVHAMMFYLLSSANPEWSIQPLGLSSDEYWGGHIFWDADTWMLPALLLQHPDLAAGIVDYRSKTLPGAQQNAKKRGLTGAEFAWESAATGREVAPEPYKNERHITSDVALAHWQYYTATQDKKWLAERGWPVIQACADYWTARAKFNHVKDNYEILNVVPPDENAEIIKNSAYTNASAKICLNIATQAAHLLGKTPNPKWAEIASKMYVPFDPKTKRFIEYDGYKGQTTKQADVELMIYPLGVDMPDDVRTATFDFYKNKAHKNGPAMTSSIHSIIAAELGRPDEAYEHFQNSYKPFLRGPFNMFNEKQSMTWQNTCFLTGCGGTLQSVIYGFAGLRIGNQPAGFKELLPGLYIKPCLPRKWKKLEIRNLSWRGKTYDLTILPGDKWRLRGQGPGVGDRS